MKTIERASSAVLSFLIASVAFAGTSVSLPFVFEKNAGQADPQVRYFGRAQGAALWLVDSGAVLSIKQKSHPAVLRITLQGARPHPKIEGAQPLPGKTNYFVGKDSLGWKKDIDQYAAVRYQDAYPGVDLVFHATAQTIEYDWIVAPGADPRQINMSFEGADSIRIDRSGDLVLRIGDAQVRERRPRVYQETAEGRTEIDGRFVRRRHNIGFEVADYDRSRALTIDPVLTFAAYMGGTGNEINVGGDIAYSVGVDGQGNIIVVGQTWSTNFPTKNALYGDFPEGVLNAFIAKVNPTGTAENSLMWSTYLGGQQGTSEGYAVALDSQGNIYVTGTTEASDFPVRNAFQNSGIFAQNCTTREGDQGACLHAFVTKISAGGNQLVYSSYLGGSSFDAPNAIALDSLGNAWLCGFTESGDFPVKGNYVQSRLQGKEGGFISKVSADGSQLLYSSYLGGESIDELNGIAVDTAGNVYVAGWSTSVSFPVVNAYQATRPAKARSGVVAKINPDATPPLVYSTYLGGTQAGGFLNAIAVDSRGDIFVAGRSAAPDFPVTTNAVQTGTALGPAGNTGIGAMIAELNPAEHGAAQLQYSTFLTGGFLDQVNGMVLDKSGRILVAGTTYSPPFPTTKDAFQHAYAGVLFKGEFSSKAFFAIINPMLAGLDGLVYSTFFGGVGFDSGSALGLDATGTIAAVAGTATSTDMFVTPNAFQRGLNSQYGNVLIATFNLAQSGPVLSSMVNAASFANPINRFAPGEIVTFFGSNLGPTALAGAELDPTGHLATSLGGCQLLVNNVPAPLIYVQANQAAAILPYELTPRIGSILVNYAQMICNNVAGNVIEFKAAAADPAIFSATQTGMGQAAVLNQDGSPNSAANPAAAGSIVQIFATGEGVLTPAGQDGRIESGPVSGIPTPALPVTVTFGMTASPKITYAGVAPGQVDGLSQINAQVPSGLTPGNVPIVLNIGKNASQQGLTIAVK